MIDRVDYAGMGTSRKHYESLSPQIHDNGGVVFHGVPRFHAVIAVIGVRHALFKTRLPRDFPEKQYVSARKAEGLLCLHKRYTGSCHPLPGKFRKIFAKTGTAFGIPRRPERGRMQDQRNVFPVDHAYQAFQSAEVIEMAVRKDHGLDLPHGDVENHGIADRTIFGKTKIKQERLYLVTLRRSYECRKTMLRPYGIASAAVHEHPGPRDDPAVVACGKVNIIVLQGDYFYCIYFVQLVSIFHESSLLFANQGVPCKTFMRKSGTLACYAPMRVHSFPNRPRPHCDIRNKTIPVHDCQ